MNNFDTQRISSKRNCLSERLSEVQLNYIWKEWKKKHTDFSEKWLLDNSYIMKGLTFLRDQG